MNSALDLQFGISGLGLKLGLGAAAHSKSKIPKCGRAETVWACDSLAPPRLSWIHSIGIPLSRSTYVTSTVEKYFGRREQCTAFDTPSNNCGGPK